MIILSIDPGPERSAFVLWDGEKVIEKRIVPSEQLLSDDWIEVYPNVQQCVIENIVSYGMAVGAETFVTCRWIGKYEERWKRWRGTTAQLVSRKDVKLHHCGSIKAKDANVRQALLDRFGMPGQKKNPNPVTYGIVKDLWSALAIAVFWGDIWKEQSANG